MSSYQRDHKREDEGVISIFQNLDKTCLLQEARYFDSSPLHPRKCTFILTKILYLLNQGETLTAKEATDLFFKTTKLFQNKDVCLRRLVYLTIKELSSVAQDVIIVTSSLTKDMTEMESLFRSAAIRALCTITVRDSSMLQDIERYMKQAIVDKNPAVNSAALVSSLHLSTNAPELVKRFVNEAQVTIILDNPLVSYHALGMVAGVRRNDRLSLVKLVTTLAQSPPRSPFALSLLIRHAAKLAQEDSYGSSDTSSKYLEFIQSCLQHHSDIVVYEAACAIITLGQSKRDLARAGAVLQGFCNSPKATTRLAGARGLSKLIAKHPEAIGRCVADLENLISDTNKSIATLAVSTLLVNSAEHSIDHLMKLVLSFISEISDEFKLIVVNAIRHLCVKYPSKYQLFSYSLADMLKKDGSLQYKSAIVEALIALVERNPVAKDIGLHHICEFIEDCEHIPLAIRILHVLGCEGPKQKEPSRYIRYIYNRMILESAPVRAAALSAIARFGALCPELLPNVKILLSRCELDEDDEVRDRAVFYNVLLDLNNHQLIDDYIIKIRVPNVVLLEQALCNHLNANPDDYFNINAIVPEEKSTENEESMVNPALHFVSLEEQYAEQLKVVPAIETFGPLFKTCEAIELTEPETEYRVSCIKHIFAHHLVLQLKCVNTLSDQILKHVNIQVDFPSGYKYIGQVSCEELLYDEEGRIFFILKFPKEPMETVGTLSITLEFTVHDCDPSGQHDLGNGYSDTYPLEDIVIGFAEQFRMVSADDNWDKIWDEALPDFEVCDTFGLSQRNINDAARAVCEHIGLPMTAISGDSVKEIRGRGIWREGVSVLIRARLVVNQGVVTMQLTVRSPNENIAVFVLAAVN